MTIVPLELYLSRGRAKLKIGLASRKQVHDKRETLKKRDVEREVARRLNDRSKK
ncbi:MAG: SsrA-binding protein [Berkelbacteria bacterium GW2011_GWA2_46_7]|uniref:SsrA-binding protein n=1 Tax=Berkelbacteria bacterium GW2011_GWA2_46_7 TaxID=1618335 RepID=A0A0G1TG74_9BACT|nr:MAG: SsrA-binding protein [Berkelbacteria bacterium GW2011_GWA2_46_7]